MNKRNIKENFDCKVVNKIYPKKLRKFLSDKKLGGIIEVPVRQNGMTSSGINLECHSNVFKLMYTYGGSEVIGYSVHKGTDIRMDKGWYLFNAHSCWLTPENKLVDVTQKKEKFCKFLPVSKIDLSCEIELYGFGLNIKKSVVHYEEHSSQNNDNLLLEMNPFPISDIHNIGFYKRVIRYRPEMFTRGGFTKPSMASKRNWNDIWQTEIDKGHRFAMSNDEYKKLEKKYGEILI